MTEYMTFALSVILGLNVTFMTYFMLKLKRTEAQLLTTLSSDQIRLLIADKQEPFNVRVEELKGNMSRIEDKLDKLLTHLSG